MTASTDDRPALSRRYLAELTRELEAKGGEAGILAALRGPDGGRYRGAIRHAAAGVIQYSGSGYPEAGLEAYGPEVPGEDLELGARLARRLIDELDLINARRVVDEVLDAYLAIDAGRDDPLALDVGDDRNRVALEVSSRRRARR